MPIRLGGVPTGVPYPPMDAAKAVINMSPVLNGKSWNRIFFPLCTEAWEAISERIARAIGNIIAVVAVLETHMEINPVIAPKARSRRRGFCATALRERIENAMRRL